eukprot:Gregarina_sp_Poly_1__3828@NODE_213_length_11325_cov_357_800853_g189_i0_p9_GENE_NODE_213_length_11325_cov_357_800853_g189_i0NODE_213_length_11325_cov_357_800853_g189_i0_p9_ORF_typecomplete_len124_score17_34RNA_pol_L_2/PF13656_6/3_1e23_NODE_213_length_11325_cov_357_800853_g189_i01004410415
MASRSSMLNRPDASEIVDLPQGVAKVTVEPDNKAANCVYITLQREDHTLGNLIRTQILRDPTAIFAGYRNPHPLEPTVEIRVQASSKSNPYAVTHNALQALLGEVHSLQQQFKMGLPKNSTPA